jgi:predicted ATPase
MARVQRQPNRLVGREQERAELLALLDDSDCCLITITGPGGIGKTRLALEVAAASDRTVAMVEYATIADPDLFLARIADALGTETRIGIDVRATLEERLRSGPHLLALDNLERRRLAERTRRGFAHPRDEPGALAGAGRARIRIGAA